VSERGVHVGSEACYATTDRQWKPGSFLRGIAFSGGRSVGLEASFAHTNKHTKN